MQTAVGVIARPGPKPTPEHVDPRLLAADPQGGAGKVVALQGQVARVAADGKRRWLELLAQPLGETTIQTVDVVLDDVGATVEPEECYRIVGVAAGSDVLGRAFVGTSRDVPLVLGTAVEPAPVGPYGVGCAAPEPAVNGARAPSS